jgi:hypothetical protein
MRYSSRDLRAVDLLAMILVGIDVLCLLLSVVVWAQGRDVNEVASKSPNRMFVGYLIGGLVFGCSGLALNLKLRELQKQGGREPPRDPEEHLGPSPGSPALPKASARSDET